MSDQDFHTQVLTALGDLKAEQAATTTEVKNIVVRLDRLNGTVARHEREFGELRIHVAERDQTCPLVEKVESRVRSLEDANTARSAAEKAEEKVNRNWFVWIRPVLWMVAGILGLLILQNAQFILRLFIH